MKLIVAEKPSVGRDIAHVLKVTGKGEGCLHNNQYIISWAIGHLVTLCDPEDYDPALKRWKMETLPIIPDEIRLKGVGKTASQLKVLRKWMTSKDVTEIICATDAGREGELIFRYIYHHLKCRKPVRRLWISSMTDQAIRDGFAALRPANDFDSLYHSARCRSQADWLVGINASRAYSIAYDAHLTIGRVQTPTLAMIVARQAEIDAFVSKDYWEVEADFSIESGNYSGKWFSEDVKDGRLDDKERADVIVAKVKGQTGRVDSQQTEEKRQLAPLLYDLAELQRHCNRKFGFSAATTLNIAQDLYEKRKAITYPRTDSRHLSRDIKLSPIIATLANLPEYTSYAKYIQSLDKLPITSRLVDDSKVTDHHAIIPTEKKPPANLTPNEYKVYDLIARRFLATFYPAHIQDVTTVVTVVAGEQFLSKGTQIRQLGWKELYADEKDDEESNELPKLTIGDAADVAKVAAKAKKTRPPKPYTEATLLSAMENAGKMVDDEEIARQMKESGLGTAATRAAIIERLLVVGYIRRQAKNLIPTDKAKSLIQILPTEITSPETTGRWEKGLTSINKGSLDPDRFMASIAKFTHFLVENAQNSPKNVQFDTEKPRSRTRTKKQAASLGKCPLCAKDVLENTKAFYCANWKGGCKLTIWKNSTKNYHFELTPAHVAAMLAGKTVTATQIILPDTHEKAVAELVLEPGPPSLVRFINLKRLGENNHPM
ncbi:MAG: DNA topoisomerase III [Defluviitaleaceae bacterium]|nr:DNA topoisomerase III [Defluviitaleaceae bacterium]